VGATHTPSPVKKQSCLTRSREGRKEREKDFTRRSEWAHSRRDAPFERIRCAPAARGYLPCLFAFFSAFAASRETLLTFRNRRA